MRASLFLTLLALCGVLSFASCKSNEIAATNNTTTIGQQCNAAPAAGDSGTASGGCSAGGVCTVNYCRTPCTTDSQCPTGSICLSGAGGDGCRLDSESSTCSAASACKTPGLVCGDDSTCRNFCNANTPCTVSGDTCHADGACHRAGGSGDGGGSSSGSSSSSGAGSSSGGSDGGGAQDGSIGAPDGNSCANPQSSFGLIGQGDSNPNFQSGVGALGPNVMYIFNGYTAPASDGGPGSQWIYVQAFDPKSGASRGPSQPLFSPPTLGFRAPNYVAGSVVLFSAAVAPTGEIALAYDLVSSGGYNARYIAFVSPPNGGGSADGGSVYGLTLQNVVEVTTGAAFSVPGNGIDGSRIIWSNASQTFVVPYKSGNPNFLSINKYSLGSQIAGGIGAVPTLQSDNSLGTTGSIGESGSLLGVEYQGSQNATGEVGLTILDESGNLVGTPIQVTAGDQSLSWDGIAGTAQGFVCFYDQIGQGAAGAVFVSTASLDAGIADSGTFPGFSLTGRIRDLRAVADNVGTGGMGGVGVALALYDGGGVSFAYVNADGVEHQGPYKVFAMGATNNSISLTNLNGSFAISAYNTATNSSQIVATGICP